MTRDNRKAQSGMATAALSANQQQALISADMTAPIQAACQLHKHTHTLISSILDKENTSGHLIQNRTEGSDNKEKDEAASGAANLAPV